MFRKRIEKGVADVTVRQVRGISTDGVVEGGVAVCTGVRRVSAARRTRVYEVCVGKVEERIVGRGTDDEETEGKRTIEKRVRTECVNGNWIRRGREAQRTTEERRRRRLRNGIARKSPEESEVVPTEKNELEFNSHAERK